MKMDRIVDLMEANGRCVREFAEFLREAKPEQLNALRKIVKNGRRWMAQAAAIEVAVEIMAVGVVSTDEADAAFERTRRKANHVRSRFLGRLFPQFAGIKRESMTASKYGSLCCCEMPVAFFLRGRSVEDRCPNFLSLPRLSLRLS